GSRFGNSKEIAEKIAEILENEKFDVTIMNLQKTNSRKWLNPEEYDGVLVGSGIKITKWTKEPLKFLKKNCKILNQKILGLFVTSASSLMNREQANEDYIQKIIVEIDLKPAITEVFNPVFDFSEKSNLGFLNKAMLKMAAQGMMNDKPELKIDFNARNDFRDWNRINSYALEFGKKVKAK
ncbi:MAG: hypothetical protein FK734_14150, partial [Asgard group archaeon]|nr:hypothetical protein [Asgard group archaeon]